MITSSPMPLEAQQRQPPVIYWFNRAYSLKSSLKILPLEDEVTLGKFGRVEIYDLNF